MTKLVRVVKLLVLTTWVVFSLVDAFSLLSPEGKNVPEIDKHQKDEGSLYSEESNIEEMMKRSKSGDPSQGKCTCTCETKLVNVDEKSANPAVDDGTASGPRPPPSGNLQSDKLANGQGHSDELAADEPGYDDVEEDKDDEMKSEQTNGLQSSDLDRYDSNYGHGSRYPWKRLPDTMCMREPCKSDKDCCKNFNICDRSGSTCRDCWYGESCSSESDCCSKYPLCHRSSKAGDDDDNAVGGGKCVNNV